MSNFPSTQFIQPEQRPRISGMAIASMILGIIGLLLSIFGGGILGVAAVVLGVISMMIIKKNPQRLGGVGMAWTGTITGTVSIAVTVFIFIFGLFVYGKARGIATNTATRAHMNGIVSAIRKYAMDFNGALPGMYPQVASGGACQTVSNKNTAALTATDAKISGTQNLVLALGYALNGTRSGVEIPGSNSFTDAAGNRYDPPFVDPNFANGPMDFSVTTVAKNSKQYPPYYSPMIYDLKTAAPGFTLTSVPYAWKNGGGNAFPVIVDRFSDPLPILYFRRDMPNGPWCADNKLAPASYYRQENSEYLDGVVTSPSGSTFDQGAQSSYSGLVPGGAGNLGDSIMAQIGATPSSSYNPRGDFVLISAGIDRIYGKSAGAAVSDDVIEVVTK